MNLIFLEGLFWPFEAMNPIIKPIAPFISFAWQTRSSLAVLFKNSSIFTQEVYKGILIYSIWAAISMIITVKILHKRKFSRNS